MNRIALLLVSLVLALPVHSQDNSQKEVEKYSMNGILPLPMQITRPILPE